MTTDQKTFPITMRFESNFVEKLKARALHESVKRNSNTSYVDLIRDAVEKEYGSDCLSNDDEFAFINNCDSFSTLSDIETFNASETGKMIAEAISSSDYSKVCNHYSGILKKYIKQKSIAMDVLYACEHKGNGGFSVARDPDSVAYVVARRGAVPDQVAEGDEIWIPPFDIAAAPSMKSRDLTPYKIADAMGRKICALRREFDTNVLAALVAACEVRNDQVIFTDMCLAVHNLMTAISKVCQHDISPHCIIVHPDVYIAMLSWGSECIKSLLTLEERFEKEDFGTFQGIKIRVTSRCKKENILVTGNPKNLGVVVSFRNPSIKNNPEPNRMREGFVIAIEVGIAVVNDYACSLIKIASEKK